MRLLWLYDVIIVAAGVCSSVSCNTCSGADQAEAYRYFSTRTAYDVARGRNLKQEIIPGVEVKRLYMVIRHGTRYPGDDEIEAMQQYLPNIQKALLKQGKNSTLCPDLLQSLNKWKLRFQTANSLEITEQGLREMYDLGQRTRDRFPSLSDSVKKDTSSWDLRYSENDRSALSAQYFGAGFIGQDIDKGPSGIDGYSVHPSNDRLLLYCDLCHSYVQHRLDKDNPEKTEVKAFNQGETIREVLAMVNRHLWLDNDTQWDLDSLNTAMEACRYEYAVYGDPTWCDILPLEAIKALEYRQDMKYYWRYGHGRDVNFKPACVILKDVLSTLRDSVSNSHKPSTVLRFGHSRSILPFLVRLGLFNESYPLLANNYNIHRNRRFHLGKINPFSSNIAFVLYENQETAEKKVKVFLNEKVIKLPGCSEELCKLTDIEKLWHKVIDECNFDEICKLKDGDYLDLNDIKTDLHHA